MIMENVRRPGDREGPLLDLRDGKIVRVDEHGQLWPWQDQLTQEQYEMIKEMVPKPMLTYEHRNGCPCAQCIYDRISSWE